MTIEERTMICKEMINNLPRTENITVPVSELKELFEATLELSIAVSKEKEKVKSLEWQVSKLSSSPRIVYRRDKQ